MRTGARITVGLVAAALLGGAGFGAYRLVEDVGDVGRQAAPGRTGPPSADEVERTAREFLAAWAKGDAEGAAMLTDNPQAASAALTGYREEAGVGKVTFRQGAAAGAQVPFTVTADVAFKNRHSTWTYTSSLGVVRGRTSGRPVVDWRPTVLHPGLAHGETLRTGPGKSAEIKAVDRSGRELDPQEFPSLTAVLPELRKRFGEKTGGREAVEVRAEPADGTAGRTLHVVDKGLPATLRTTLDARVQRAAEEAVARRDEASVVAVRPSTGEILAVADTGARRAGFNAALLGRTAPGSTLKTVTAAMLLEKGAAHPSQPLPCPEYATYGKQFHNVENGEDPGATFARDFAASCNTAFVSLAGKVADGDLGAEAREVFGVGMDNWQTGVTTFDGRIPDGAGAEKAAAMIGQGRVQMNPLTMASVTATVKDGTFRQPRLVDPEAAGLRLARAARPLPAPVAAELRRMMRLTAVAGTGRTAMAGLDGDVGAKTGSAEIDGQDRPNGWFTAYRNDVAAAAVVPRGGHGGDSAGPVVAAVLRAG
ncbi:penicillin-binding transpeptidase domain-containing protein [Streptomyces caatingaensis]|uniref:Penicillin-binding protein n=1 Tax=Streptomyces caatingaensis TaxID=1678637 RepID=A0A0K9XMX2_9ACTN|nr:penicillin-binding transpeptidase domain-containing protein [Streptomyces caatingaensis]KNB54461.1 penicillin-binding protein [Streptomyces caatingaensis]